MLKVSAIVVTFNRVDMLKKNLQCLLNQNYKLNTIIVINNNSSDNTKNYLRSLHNPCINYVNLSKNIGGAGGFSLGLKLAYEKSNSNYFWLMDDDAMPTNNALKALITASIKLNNNFGFLCSNVRFNNTNIPTNVPVVSYDWTKCLPGNLIKLQEASFVSLFTRRNIVKIVGLPIGQMFIWGDDCEYTYRISHKYNSYLVADSLVVHKSKVNNNNKKAPTNIFNTHRIKFYRYSYRNYLFINKKIYGYSGFLKKLIGDIKSVVEIPFVSKNQRIKRCYYALLGIIEGLFFKPTIKFPK